MNNPSTLDRLSSLQRDDKWFLSCGDGILWAPPFPSALHLPGYWDEALVYYHPIAPLFTVALVGQDGNELQLSQVHRTWQPDRLTVEWRAQEELTLLEQRYALPGGRLTSSWQRVDGESWTADILASASLVAFTAQPGEEVDQVQRQGGSSLRWKRTPVDRSGAPLPVVMTMSVDADQREGSTKVAASRSEGRPELPAWRATPFWESWCRDTGSGLTDEVSLSGLTDTGSVYIAVEAPLRTVLSSAIGFTVHLNPLFLEEDTHLESHSPIQHSAPETDPAVPWVEFLESFPHFTCSDPYLERYYDYRLYGLRLNRLSGNAGNLRSPAIAEGISYFHVPITYSAQCHMWETRWSLDTNLAHGSLLNFLDHQRDDGSFHGRIYTQHMVGTDFYHANWGDGVLAVDAVHSDDLFLQRAYEGLSRYADWLDRTRDREGSGMYDVVNHFETGQEYMSRYQVVDPSADDRGWKDGFRLKGIDVTVYTYQLKRALATIATRFRRHGEADAWSRSADDIGRAIMQIMWDPQSGMFSDVDSQQMSRTGVKAAVCFYPLLTDLPDEAVVKRLAGHLHDPREFATPFPVPSSSLDDPLFSASAEWKGKRHNCPWNGRTWPMVNSHIIEGLLRQWHHGRRQIGRLASHILTRFVQMMFHGGDVSRPNCYEHYNPITGHASVYRGIDDYQHSWVLDLIIRGAIGLEPRSKGILVDPLPLDLDRAALTGASVQGHSIDVHREGREVTVAMGGTRHRTVVGQPLEIPYD